MSVEQCKSARASLRNCIRRNLAADSDRIDYMSPRMSTLQVIANAQRMDVDSIAESVAPLAVKLALVHPKSHHAVYARSTISVDEARTMDLSAAREAIAENWTLTKDVRGILTARDSTLKFHYYVNHGAGVYSSDVNPYVYYGRYLPEPTEDLVRSDDDLEAYGLHSIIRARPEHYEYTDSMRAIAYDEVPVSNNPRERAVSYQLHCDYYRRCVLDLVAVIARKWRKRAAAKRV